MHVPNHTGLSRSKPRRAMCRHPVDLSFSLRREWDRKRSDATLVREKRRSRSLWKGSSASRWPRTETAVRWPVPAALLAAWDDPKSGGIYVSIHLFDFRGRLWINRPSAACYRRNPPIAASICRASCIGRRAGMLFRPCPRSCARAPFRPLHVDIPFLRRPNRGTMI